MVVLNRFLGHPVQYPTGKKGRLYLQGSSLIAVATIFNSHWCPAFRRPRCVFQSTFIVFVFNSYLACPCPVFIVTVDYIRLSTTRLSSAHRNHTCIPELPVCHDLSFVLLLLEKLPLVE